MAARGRWEEMAAESAIIGKNQTSMHAAVCYSCVCEGWRGWKVRLCTRDMVGGWLGVEMTDLVDEEHDGCVEHLGTCIQPVYRRQGVPYGLGSQSLQKMHLSVSCPVQSLASLTSRPSSKLMTTVPRRKNWPKTDILAILKWEQKFGQYRCLAYGLWKPYICSGCPDIFRAFRTRLIIPAEMWILHVYLLLS
jgi:hypothetical protein